MGSINRVVLTSPRKPKPVFVAQNNTRLDVLVASVAYCHT